MTSQGRYSVVEEKRDGEKIPRDIRFTVLESTTGPIPENQLELVAQVQDFLSHLQLIFESNNQLFTRYFTQLLSFARVGLTGEHAHPEFAVRLINNLKTEILQNEAKKAKNRYMKSLGKAALLQGGLAALIASLLWLVFEELLQWDKLLFVNMFYLWTGCTAGTWLSFGIRKTTLKFEELHTPEADLMEPHIRLLFAGLLAQILVLIFTFKLVTLKVGDFMVSAHSFDVYSALLIGAMCGISELALPNKVATHAANMFQK